jgi:hypothetical protein
MMAGVAAAGCAAKTWHTTVVYGQLSPGVPPPGEAVPIQCETASVVVPPSADGQPWANGCPASGRAFVAFGDFADGNRGTSVIYSQSLDCLGQPGCMVDAPRVMRDEPTADKHGSFWVRAKGDMGQNGSCLAGPTTPGARSLPSFPHYDGGTDMMMARVPLVRATPTGPVIVPGGRIVHFWQAGRHLPTPVPASDSLSGWGGKGALPAPSCAAVLKHVGIMVRWSDDCGATWSEPTFVDPDDFVDQRGQKLMAMEVRGGTGLYVREKGYVWGVDRFEIYADPFNPGPNGHPALYLATVVVLPNPQSSEPVGERRIDAIFRSLDGGETWQAAHLFPDWGGGPKVMTSTESGRVFLGRCIGVGGGVQRFQLFWLDGQGSQLKGSAYVDFKNGKDLGQCRSLPSAELFGGVQNAVVDEGLARVASDRSSDTIRAAYVGVENGKQIIYVVRVRVSRSADCEGAGAAKDGCVEVISEHKLEGGEGRSLMHPHFIESDRMEYAPDSTRDVPTVLSYLEWPSVKNPQAGAIARFFAVAGEKWSEAGTLSVLGGQPAGWAPREKRSFIGDYDYGSFFAVERNHQPHLYYFSQWPQSDAHQPADSQPLRANVLQITRLWPRKYRPPCCRATLPPPPPPSARCCRLIS